MQNLVQTYWRTNLRTEFTAGAFKIYFRTWLLVFHSASDFTMAIFIPPSEHKESEAFKWPMKLSIGSLYNWLMDAYIIFRIFLSVPGRIKD